MLAGKVRACRSRVRRGRGFKSDAAARAAMVDEADCIRALREAAEEPGESPSEHQHEARGTCPAANSILREMGGWLEAKRAAGLALVEPGGRGGMPFQSKPQDLDVPDGLAWEDTSPQQRCYCETRDHRIAIEEHRRWRVHGGSPSKSAGSISNVTSKARLREEIDNCQL